MHIRGLVYGLSDCVTLYITVIFTYSFEGGSIAGIVIGVIIVIAIIMVVIVIVKKKHSARAHRIHGGTVVTTVHAPPPPQPQPGQRHLVPLLFVMNTVNVNPD